MTTKKEYLQKVAYLENLAKKGEENLSKRQLKEIHDIAVEIESYEDTYLMEKDSTVNEKKAKKNSTPSLIEIVEFTMFQKKLTQAKLAEMIGQPASKVSKILNKQRNPDISFLKALHEKLHIDGNFILESI